MAGHLLDMVIFSSRKRTDAAKWVWFGITAGIVFLSFLWFKDVAYGIEGPIADTKGLKWRQSWNVS